MAIVYIHLKNGYHYHRVISCPAIEVAPDKMEYEAIEDKKVKVKRNTAGHQFRQCPICFRKRHTS